ncbi:late embryogenesis abundant protein 6-like [Vitis riparia]|uniref:late embryogenesis abundant protein 6-like n=1 Tax=Vitis riparia TaxID=96939 RepID=UPI00155A2644|nr:late embryogenesis abundant protein 6-like [Vitis riparia]
MQAVKEKLNEMSTMRKAKADARAEEKAEKELAKARVEVAKEVRKAKEAEAAMDLHVAKAEDRAHQELVKHAQEQS